MWAQGPWESSEGPFRACAPVLPIWATWASRLTPLSPSALRGPTGPCTCLRLRWPSDRSPSLCAGRQGPRPAALISVLGNLDRRVPGSWGPGVGAPPRSPISGWLPASPPGALWPAAVGRRSFSVGHLPPASAPGRDLQPQGQEVQGKMCRVNTALGFEEEVRPTGRLRVFRASRRLHRPGLRGAPASTPTRSRKSSSPAEKGARRE